LDNAAGENINFAGPGDLDLFSSHITLLVSALAAFPKIAGFQTA
jgi:hypothetical protein